MKKDYFHCLEQICFGGGINFIQQEAGESVLFINNVATLLRWRSGVAPPEFCDAPACFFLSDNHWDGKKILERRQLMAWRHMKPCVEAVTRRRVARTQRRSEKWSVDHIFKQEIFISCRMFRPGPQQNIYLSSFCILETLFNGSITNFTLFYHTYAFHLMATTAVKQYI